MAGKPCVRGLRVTVSMIAGLQKAGRTSAEILEAYPYLEKEDLEQVAEVARRDSIEVD